MKRPTFFEGVAVALVLSIVGAALTWLATNFIGRDGALFGLISGLGFLYLLYLLVRSKTRVGRITTVATWAVVTIMTWIAGLPIMFLLLLQVGFIWLVRSLYFYSSALAGLLDLGLIATSLITAFWAAFHSGSLFLGL